MPSFKKVLVTGGAGFIGSHTVDLLLERGYTVRVLDNLEPQVHGDLDSPPDYLSKECEFIRGDVLDRSTLRRALDGVDAIIHDAAMVGVGQSQYQIYRYVHANTSGTANLLDLIVTEKLPVERLLVASSMSLYGEGLYKRPSDGAHVSPFLRPEKQMEALDFEVRDEETGEALEFLPTPESKPLNCTSIYALSKKNQEEYTLLAARTHGLSAVACRYFNVYGTRQSLSNPYTGVCAIFSSRLKNGNPPLIYEDGLQSRDFINVRDLVEAKLFLLENPKANLDAFNLCTGRSTSVLRIAELLAELMGCPQIQPQVVKKFRAGDIRHCIGDHSRMKSLGWEPRVSLEEGLKVLVRWSENQEAIDRIDQAHRELVEKGMIKE